ncbi:MAG: GNAT family N-acetyltransferase [Desulfobacteraceae bacterium]|nr:GNAT family N-acetyltransferase [Desulfobacteraceae bacterium]
MDNIKNKVVAFDQVKILGKDIKRDGVTLANPPGAIWIGATDDDKIVGVVCIVINSKTKTARYKSDFVLKDYRKRGIYRKLFQLRESFVRMKGVKTATAFCSFMSINCYVKYGFVPQRRKVNTDNVFVKKVYV